MRKPWNPGDRLRRRAGAHIAPADAGRWQVRWDFDEVAFLEGPAFSRVLPWLVPRLEEDVLYAELQQSAAAAGYLDDFVEVVDSLCDAGFLLAMPACPMPAHLSGDDPAGAQPLMRAAEALRTNPADMLQSLRQTPVVVCGRSLLAKALLRLLPAQGFAVRTAAANVEDLRRVFAADPIGAKEVTEFPIVVEPDWPASEINRLNERALATRREWMLAGAWNRRAMIGPIFVPGQTACYTCYRGRLDSHRAHLAAYTSFVESRRDQNAPIELEPVLPAIAEISAGLVVLELFAHMTAIQTSRTVGRALVYYPTEARLTNEAVLRHPWCPSCMAGM